MKFLSSIELQYSDVLVLDKVGSEYIRYCVPNGLTVRVLDVRNTVPYINSPLFFLNLFKRIFQFGVNRRAIYTAITETINPKVIITFIDNSSLVSLINKAIPDLLAISIQNGIRVSLDMNHASTNGKYCLPHYFAFGKYEYGLIKKNNINVEGFYSAGSLKMGIFLSEKYKPSLECSNEKSVCFISQYRVSNLSEQLTIEKELFSYVVLFCSNNNYELKVILRNNSTHSSYENEVNFFNSSKSLDRVTLCENNSDNLSAYIDSFESSIIVALDSTLALELFSQGKKVLFCPVYKVKSLRNIEYRTYLSNLPEINALEELDISKFNKKFYNLLDMDNNEYSLYTKDARGDYMNYEQPYVHEIVSEFISRRINV